MTDFQSLENRFGGPAAYQYLLEMEKAALIKAREVSTLSLETRFMNVMYAQDNSINELRIAA